MNVEDEADGEEWGEEDEHMPLDFGQEGRVAVFGRLFAEAPRFAYFGSYVHHQETSPPPLSARVQRLPRDGSKGASD